MVNTWRDRFRIPAIYDAAWTEDKVTEADATNREMDATGVCTTATATYLRPALTPLAARHPSDDVSSSRWRPAAACPGRSHRWPPGRVHWDGSSRSGA